MPGQYVFREIEEKWQQRWVADASVECPHPRARRIVSLAGFFSNSARPHLGHVRTYAVADALARYRRMRGDHITHATHWDASGISAALDRRDAPDGWRADHVRRLRRLGIATPSDAETARAESERARAVQRAFVRMLARGVVRCKRGSTGPGWYLELETYVEELWTSSDALTGWPEALLTAHRGWIGRSEGAHIDFAVVGRPGLAVRVFTRRPETTFGVTYLVLAPEHPLVDALIDDEAERQAAARLQAETANLSDAERLACDVPTRGVRLRARVVNPFSGAEIPLFLAEYAVMSYGTGAVMAAPCEDHRDWEFARLHGLPGIEVQSPPGWNGASYTGGGVMVNSGFLDGLPAADARRRATAWLAGEQAGAPAVYYRLQEWKVSGQGDGAIPIPVVHCATCGTVAAPVEVVAAIDRSAPPDTSCPRCGSPGRPEPQVIVPSVEAAWDTARPVDQYVCGGDGAGLHLLHARVAAMVFRDLGIEDARAWCPKVVLVEGAAGTPDTPAYRDADALVATFGADAVRLFALFAAPPDKRLEWSESGVAAAARFLNRLWRFVDEHGAELPAASGDARTASSSSRAVRAVMDATITRVTRDVDDGARFNTAISAIHELTHALQAFAEGADAPRDERRRVLRDGIETTLLLLAPIVPHVAEELWERLGHARSIACEAWPTADGPADGVASMPVQVDGRVRAQIMASPDLAKDDLIAQALADAKIRPWLDGREVVRVVVVPGRLLNVVTRARA